ncbi:MAG: hypothetical protein KBF88_06060 [Polyangiaceae bacterium]|nr:hypothetical protein [Polyangiaceae bacterium]
MNGHPSTRLRETCKFLSGAFFVSAGVLAYLHWTKVPIPFGSVLIMPEVHGMRAIVHGILFGTTFYLGFLRKT